MRTASFALLFSATVAAPAFANGDGPATSYRPEVATYTQPGTVPRAQVTTSAVDASRRVASTQN